MDQENMIKDFVQLAGLLEENKTLWPLWAQQARVHNQWFTEESVVFALSGISYMLSGSKLEQLMQGLTLKDRPKKVGVIMAGNLPLVGFHDFMCILLTGHTVFAKVSSQDPLLIKIISDLLIRINPALEKRIFFVDRLNNMDAVIATGSDNSARYFNYYFAAIPHIIRKNRTSLGILNSFESEDDFVLLGKDIFTYYGLGCRNISKLYVPEAYIFNTFFEVIERYSQVGNHTKYKNNYDYNKSVYLINGVQHLDNGFLLVTESKELVSPLGVLFFENYNSLDDLSILLNDCKEKIQVIASKDRWYHGSIDFGKAQMPEPWDFADNVNTLQFLISLE